MVHDDDRGLRPEAARQILCVDYHDNGRAQIAAAAANGAKNGRVRAHSAAVDLHDTIDPEVLDVLRDKQHDVDDLFPNPITGRERVRRPVAGRGRDAVLAAYDHIRRDVEKLFQELLPETQPA